MEILFNYCTLDSLQTTNNNMFKFQVKRVSNNRMKNFIPFTQLSLVDRIEYFFEILNKSRIYM